MLSPGLIMISDLLVTNLFMHALPGTYHSTLLGHTLFTLKVFLHEIYMHIHVYIHISRLVVVSHEDKKKQHTCASSRLSDHYSELYTCTQALEL